jgi:hypothetical protein
MRDRSDCVVYVGKAKNLQKRLASYRVANPDRLPRRHLEMLRAVWTIELQPCVDESCALAQEARLLKSLRPRFNRAGTWPAAPRFFAWRSKDCSIQLAVTQTAQSDWQQYGPLGTGAVQLRAVIARLLWCALQPESGIAGLPQGWFCGRRPEIRSIFHDDPERTKLGALQLERFFVGHSEQFISWILDCTASWKQPFDIAIRDADLEILSRFSNREQLVGNADS